jgi:hypothetical protein
VHHEVSVGVVHGSTALPFVGRNLKRCRNAVLDTLQVVRKSGRMVEPRDVKVKNRSVGLETEAHRAVDRDREEVVLVCTLGAVKIAV